MIDKQCDNGADEENSENLELTGVAHDEDGVFRGFPHK
jgi:hypothetical protein